jgi:hypothetical protein
MTIEEAMTLAMDGGYHIHGSDGVETSYSGASSDYSAWTRKDNQSSFIRTLSASRLGARISMPAWSMPVRGLPSGGRE